MGLETGKGAAMKLRSSGALPPGAVPEPVEEGLIYQPAMRKQLTSRHPFTGNRLSDTTASKQDTKACFTRLSWEGTSQKLQRGAAVNPVGQAGKKGPALT